MSCPTLKNLQTAQNMLKYAIGSMDEKINYRPTDASDPHGNYNNEMMAFSDSDWSNSVEYYGASEGCRELAYIRGILEDFYGSVLSPTTCILTTELAVQWVKR